MYKFEVKENVLFKEQNTADFYIEVTEGPYEGLCFVFGPITFNGEDENGNGLISFDYHLLHIPEDINFEKQNKEIEIFVGQMLQHILETQVQDVNDETGTSNTESTDNG
jgi:hypothetical protein